METVRLFDTKAVRLTEDKVMELALEEVVCFIPDENDPLHIARLNQDIPHEETGYTILRNSKGVRQKSDYVFIGVSPL